MADFIVPVNTRPDEQAKRRLGGPIHAERHISVICVGAGASGLLMAYKMQKHFTNYDLTVFEKNPEVSGTWFENRYPGCACDVPSHNYTWSFEPKLDWTGVYSGSKEIYAYFNSFAEKYNLKHYIKTQHQVVGAIWNNATGGWDVKIQDISRGIEFTKHCDILINASGILNNWRWPAIPGLDKYRGTLLHTANWQDGVDLSGKHVGLIGNGSSGIQVLPQVQPICPKVTTFIREPTWVSPVQGLEQHIYTAEEKADFAIKPNVLTEYRKAIERGLNGQFGIFLKNTKPNNDTHAYMLEQMKSKLSNKYLEERLIPEWSVGCRRMTPGVGYLEALTKPNVKVVYGEINSITERGCLCDDGNEYPVDVLICATGFDTTFKPRFPLIGPTGSNLQDVWQKAPESYWGMAAAEFPNYMIFLGPNSPIGNGPVLSAIEAQADYICKWIDRYQTYNIKTFAPRVDAINDFIEHKDEFMKRSVWNDPCRSWYKAGPSGKVTALWPGSTLHYIEALLDLRVEDWDVKYSGNRFSYLGNGYSQTELDPTADWGYYIRETDDDAPISRGAKMRLINKSGTIKQSQDGVDFSGKKAKPVGNPAFPSDAQSRL